MSRTRLLHWTMPESPPPKHPYRDTLLVYAALAGVVVLVSWATGGNVVRAAVVGGLFFVVASAYTAYRFRVRLREQAADAPRGEDGLP